MGSPLGPGVGKHTWPKTNFYNSARCANRRPPQKYPEKSDHAKTILVPLMNSCECRRKGKRGQTGPRWNRCQAHRNFSSHLMGLDVRLTFWSAPVVERIQHTQRAEKTCRNKTGKRNILNFVSTLPRLWVWFSSFYQQSNPPSLNPSSPGPVSPEADLCGESSRHHVLGVFRVYMNSTCRSSWAYGTKSEGQKPGFNQNQMQHCPPRSSVMLCVRSSSDSHAARRRPFLSTTNNQRLGMDPQILTLPITSHTHEWWLTGNLPPTNRELPFICSKSLS